MRRAVSTGTIGIRVRAGMKRAVVSMPLEPLASLEKVCWGLRFRKWRRDQRTENVPYFPNRTDLYEYVNGTVLHRAAIDFLEFGVSTGESMRAWLGLNTNSDSRFFGFDTFLGLPEEWKHFGYVSRKGEFSTGGRPPIVEGDTRVAWIVGMFQDTLPVFLGHFSPRNGLVIHLDPDLYSSTLYVLSVLNPILVSGTTVLFDDFACFDNQFRALGDFSSAFRRGYRILACGGDYYDKVAIQF
jgi:O-methyltransferase